MSPMFEIDLCLCPTRLFTLQIIVDVKCFDVLLICWHEKEREREREKINSLVLTWCNFHIDESFDLSPLRSSEHDVKTDWMRSNLLLESEDRKRKDVISLRSIFFRTFIVNFLVLFNYNEAMLTCVSYGWVVILFLEWNNTWRQYLICVMFYPFVYSQFTLIRKIVYQFNFIFVFFFIELNSGLKFT